MSTEARDQLATSLAFAITEGIESGALDLFLPVLALSIKQRVAMLDKSKPPTRTQEMIDNAQVWAWMNGPNLPHWEIRGMGARL